MQLRAASFNSSASYLTSIHSSVTLLTGILYLIEEESQGELLFLNCLSELLSGSTLVSEISTKLKDVYRDVL